MPRSSVHRPIQTFVGTPMTMTKVNLVTGWLGVGKTTALKHLLAQRPAGEMWAVIVNEFGEIGLDGAAISEVGTGVWTKELAGGCLCCTAQLPLQVTLTELLRKHRPVRLLIEPTGLGHPAGVLDTFRATTLAPYFDVFATLALVDPRQWASPELQNDATYLAQLDLADRVYLNKTDRATPEEIAACRAGIEALYPPKEAVLEIQQGQIQLPDLDAAPYPRMAQAVPHLAHGSAATPEPAALGGQRWENHGARRYTAGWVFPPTVVFDPFLLKNLLAEWRGFERVKGAFRVGKTWWLVNIAEGDVTIDDLAYRRDSRLEVISTTLQDWAALEAALAKTAGTPD